MKACRLIVVVFALLFSITCAREDGGQNAQKRELTVWQILVSSTEEGSLSPDWYASFEYARKQFEKETGATLNNVYIANEAYKAQIKAAVAAGEAPDLFYSWAGNRGMDFVRAGAAEDVTEEVTRMIGKSFLQLHADAYLKADGKYYGFPILYSSKFMFYNKDIFNKHNLSIPKTFEDIVSSCEIFNAHGTIPLSIGNGESWQANHYMSLLNPRYVGTSVVQTDYALISPEDALYTDEGYVTALKKLQSLNEQGCFQKGVNTTTPDVAWAMFTAEKAAMFFGGTWRFPSLRQEENKHINYDFSILPPAQDQKSDEVLNVLGVDGLIVSSKSKNKDLAVKFIEALLSKEAQELWGDFPLNPHVDLSSATPAMQKALALLKTIDIPLLWADLGMDQVVSEYYLNATQGMLAGSVEPAVLMEQVRKLALARKAELGF